jgi:uncharacterized membrane protein YdbT with pleckstrin-like domain
MANGYVRRLLGENEEILLIARQHWFMLVSSIILEIAFILGVIVLAIILSVVIQQPAVTPIIIIAAIVIILLPVFTMTRDALVFANRMYIVTNRRVVQVAGILNKSVIDSSLEKVNDVKMVQSALGRLFDYGDVEILTASELGVNLFRRITEPVKFKTAMLNAKARLERGDAQASGPADIPSTIERLDQLRKQGTLTDEEFQRLKTELLSKL